MNKFVHALRPSTTTAVLALAIIVGGASITSNAHAQGTEREVRDSTIDRQNTSTDEAQKQLRTQQREALDTKRQEARAAAEAQRKARHEARQEKLSASKLEICKTREDKINARIARIAERSTQHLVLFNNISERAQAFYTSKGNTLANYDELVTDVNSKKAAAEIAVATITSTTASFDCEGENPKIAIETFKTSLNTSIDVLKEYRNSVKNLIVGIKSVNTTSSDNDTKPAEGTE